VQGDSSKRNESRVDVDREIARSASLDLRLSEAIQSIDAIAADLAISSSWALVARSDSDAMFEPEPISDEPVSDAQLETDPERRGLSSQKSLGGERRWRLSNVNVDGSVGAQHPIQLEVTEIGRQGSGISVPEDVHMADHHASLVAESGEFYIVDTGKSKSGVWLRIDPVDGLVLESEDQVSLGSQILVAAREGEIWTLVHYGNDGRIRNTYPVGEAGTFVGRGSGLVLDSSDELLSRRHAQFCLDGDSLRVFDRGSRNGTFVKIRGAALLVHGSEFRIATKSYRLECEANHDNDENRV
jgi:pSer/pThr/pTyr-binding forkhead associated (FHA) protein